MKKYEIKDHIENENYDAIAQAMAPYLALKDKDYAQVHTVTKNNGVTKLSLIVVREGRNCSPNLYFEVILDKCTDSENAAEAVAKAYLTVENENGLNIGENAIEAVFAKRKQICACVVNTEKNAKLLAEVPHRDICDLSLIYRVMLSADHDGKTSFIVKNDMMYTLGYESEEELYEAATNFMQESDPFTCRNILDVLVSMGTMVPPEIIAFFEKTQKVDKLAEYGEHLTKIAQDIENGLQTIDDLSDCVKAFMKEDFETVVDNARVNELAKDFINNPDEGHDTINELIKLINDEIDRARFEDIANKLMYVLSNKTACHGASVIAFPQELSKLANRARANLVLLPSSIHEVIAIPVIPELVTADALYEMVAEVNANSVPTEDILSDSVYYFNRETGELSVLNRELYLEA